MVPLLSLFVLFHSIQFIDSSDSSAIWITHSYRIMIMSIENGNKLMQLMLAMEPVKTTNNDSAMIEYFYSLLTEMKPTVLTPHDCWEFTQADLASEIENIETGYYESGAYLDDIDYVTQREEHLEHAHVFSLLCEDYFA